MFKYLKGDLLITVFFNSLKTLGQWVFKVAANTVETLCLTACMIIFFCLEVNNDWATIYEEQSLSLVDLGLSTVTACWVGNEGCSAKLVVCVDWSTVLNLHIIGTTVTQVAFCRIEREIFCRHILLQLIAEGVEQLFPVDLDIKIVPVSGIEKESCFLVGVTTCTEAS